MSSFRLLMRQRDTRRLQRRWWPMLIVFVVISLGIYCWQICFTGSMLFVGRPLPHATGHAVRVVHALAGPETSATLVDVEENFDENVQQQEEEQYEEEGATNSNEFISFWLLLTGASSFGLILAIPRLVAAVVGIKGQSMEDNLRNFVLNAVITAFFGFLTKLDYDNEDKRQKAAAVMALARLAVRASPSNELIALGTLGSSSSEAWCTYICVGSAEFCRTCMTGAKKSAAGMRQERLYLLAIPVTVDFLPDKAALGELSEVATGASQVALPEFSSAPDAWAAFCENEQGRLQEQGVSLFDGVCVVLGSSGQVQRRFLGVPEWPEASAASTPTSGKMT